MPSPERVYPAVVWPLDVVLRTRAERLARAGCESPRLDAELLLGEVLGLDRAGLVREATRALSYVETSAFDALVERREAREPVAYILRRKAFRGIELRVDDRVLIPRPETELLVEVTLELPRGSRVADVGTGSGAVALSLAQERPDLVVRGLDVSPEAVAVARDNADRLGLPVRFACCDLLDDGEYDAVVANLPYVADGERDRLPAEVVHYEPPVALFGGEDGLSLIRRLVKAVGSSVGFLALEVGHDQAAMVASLLATAGFRRVQPEADLAGHERVLRAWR